MSEEIDIDISSVESDQHLTFVLSDEEFAIPVMLIKEIIEYDHLTNVPMVPDFIKGVVNLRGNVVPVLNLASKFGLDIKDIGIRTCIIILDARIDDEEMILGIVVDKVLQVIEISEDKIEPAPALGAKIRTNFIKGMGKLDNSFIIILETAQVLSAQELSLVNDIHNEKEIDN